MRILILGANGQLGSDLSRWCKSQSIVADVTALCRQDIDISNLDAVKAVLSRYEFEALINCTSYHKTDEVEQRATEAFAINAQAPQRMAAACKAKRARFIHISTDYVFGGGSLRPYVESDGTSPLNVYGASKLLGENLALREYPEGSMIARVASLFGIAGSSGKGGNFVETMLRIAREKGEVRVVNDIRMSPTSTADAARVILSLIEKRAAPGVYHVVNSGEATWFEFAREIISQAGIPAKVTPVTSQEFPTAAVRPSYSVLSNEKAATIAGPIPEWRDALNRYLYEKGHLAPSTSAAGKN
ncbi:MAG TPA: dTDP-4-dehydrorhamnose reductase [Terriglobia bacterium]|nr:dTDP-4-dehydrorhamnose reductase [Terriglobia bacterium]